MNVSLVKSSWDLEATSFGGRWWWLEEDWWWWWWEDDCFWATTSLLFLLLLLLMFLSLTARSVIAGKRDLKNSRNFLAFPILTMMIMLTFKITINPAQFYSHHTGGDNRSKGYLLLLFGPLAYRPFDYFFLLKFCVYFYTNHHCSVDKTFKTAGNTHVFISTKNVIV